MLEVSELDREGRSKGRPKSTHEAPPETRRVLFIAVDRKLCTCVTGADGSARSVRQSKCTICLDVTTVTSDENEGRSCPECDTFWCSGCIASHARLQGLRRCTTCSRDMSHRKVTVFFLFFLPTKTSKTLLTLLQ